MKERTDTERWNELEATYRRTAPPWPWWQAGLVLLGIALVAYYLWRHW